MITARDYTEDILGRMIDYQNIAESWALSKMDNDENDYEMQQETIFALENERWLTDRSNEREDMELIALLREAADRLEARYK